MKGGEREEGEREREGEGERGREGERERESREEEEEEERRERIKKTWGYISLHVVYVCSSHVISNSHSGNHASSSSALTLE